MKVITCLKNPKVFPEPGRMAGTTDTTLFRKDMAVEEWVQARRDDAGRILPPVTPNTMQGYYLLPEMREILDAIRRVNPLYEFHLCPYSNYGPMACRDAPASVDTFMVYGDTPVFSLEGLEAGADPCYRTSEQGYVALSCFITHPDSSFVQGILEVTPKGRTMDGFHNGAVLNDIYKYPIVFHSPRIQKDVGKEKYVLISKRPKHLIRHIKTLLATPIAGEEERGILQKCWLNKAQEVVANAIDNLVAEANTHLRAAYRSDDVRKYVEDTITYGTAELPEHVRNNITTKQAKLREAEAMANGTGEKLWWVVYRTATELCFLGCQLKYTKPNPWSTELTLVPDKICYTRGTVEEHVGESTLQAVNTLAMLNPGEFEPSLGYRTERVMVILADRDAVRDAGPYQRTAE